MPHHDPESVLRLHWLEVSGMPPPKPQVWVPDGGCARYRLDIGNEDLRYGAEYDGRAFHEDELADAERREWLDEASGWVIDVFVAPDCGCRRACACAGDGSRRSEPAEVTARRIWDLQE